MLLFYSPYLHWTMPQYVYHNRARGSIPLPSQWLSVCRAGCKVRTFISIARKCPITKKYSHLLASSFSTFRNISRSKIPIYKEPQPRPPIHQPPVAHKHQSARPQLKTDEARSQRSSKEAGRTASSVMWRIVPEASRARDSQGETIF